ncbi:MAG: TIGR04376 family protein [Leptolyngbya sp. IPPAS B-1204]|uniref:TIGR04376 family protein n=1 Tax=Leptolyngbya sp. NK1-12 TaxID=2547451 RepID=A0AA97AGV4_9CYAN|nr:TIGR04376 family protein [Leptolyngbya sp. NK1-12]RNJ69129.1 MAG: TIGR04376 family protein [Leptolyngbya sp. IPPAS B-1204]WNZ23879.1 TIGR04376 family protein [Leptolyngbya sp. NK1-12]
MGLFEDLSSFLEMRLEEFLRNNPHLELQALEENLREQEEETIKLLGDLRLREKRLQDEILATAQEIQRWHVRIEKAKNAQRFDLVKPAEEREAALLRQGNQLWGQMEVLKQRIQQTIELQKQIQTRRQEVRTKVAEAQANRFSYQAASNPVEQQWQTSGWNQTFRASSAADPLEQAFRKWETDEELEELKRQMNR